MSLQLRSDVCNIEFPHCVDLASDVVQLLALLEQGENGKIWARNVNIVGLSMGGMVAQEALLMDPSRFGSLTLIATHAGGIVGTLPPPHGAMPLLQTFGGLGGTGALDAGISGNIFAN